MRRLPEITFSAPPTAELCALHAELEAECAALRAELAAPYSCWRDDQVVRYESARAAMDRIDQMLGMRVRIEHQVQARIDQLTQARSTDAAARCA